MESEYGLSLIFAILLSTLRMSLPLWFASTGGYFSEKAGVPQISLEGFLLTGAFTAASVFYYSSNLFLSFLIAGLVSVLVSFLFSYLVFILRASAIVVGTGINLVVMGLIPLVSKKLFDSTGSTPALQLNLNEVTFFVAVMTVLLMGVSYYLSEKSLWGLQVKFAGEKAAVLKSLGVSPLLRKFQAVCYGAFVTGLGGAILSLYLSSSYSPLMSAGRGFMALAAVIFAGWKLQKSWLVVLFFGFTDALQIPLQNAQIKIIPNEFIQMLPYSLTLFALVVLKNKQQAPKEMGVIDA